jgi:hypothetical protein
MRFIPRGRRVKQMTEVERQLWQLNLELAQMAFNSLDRMALPGSVRTGDLEVAKERIEHWLDQNRNRWP